MIMRIHEIMEEKMVRKMRILFTISVFMMLLFGNFSFGQKGFYMSEKKLYEKYKMSVKHFEKGKEHYHKGDYKKAEKELQKCLEVFPKHNQAHFYLSSILYSKKKFSKALDHIEEAKINFEFMNQMYVLAFNDYIFKLREQREECQKKISEYQDKLAVTTDREEKQTFENAVASYENELRTIDSRLTEPLPQIKEIPADYYYLHGNIFFKSGKLKEAYNQYIEAVRIDPQHGNAFNNLANLYFMSKQYQQALDCLNMAEVNGVKINPEFKKAILKALGK